MISEGTPFRIPVQQLAWATDLHLNFLRGKSLAKFCDPLAESATDAIAITGDISDGPSLESHLHSLAQSTQKPIFFLLGNHDRYHTSFAEAEKIVKRVTASYPHLHRLTGREIVELSPHTALVGVDGWADGQSGSGPDSPIVLNDTIHIRDLAELPRPAQWKMMAELAQASAETIKPALDEAMASHREVILLTHVPPLREATWHEGQISAPDFLPHFCNARLGEVIREACARHSETNLLVLCGHTHSEGVHRENNLTVLTGKAVYGQPRIDRVIQIG